MEVSKNLFDILGIFIGFVCVILLLSIVVTSMVQTIQASIRLRARNLQKGIQTIIETLYGNEDHDPKVLALRALHAKSVCFFGRIDNRPEISLKRFLGPPISYIDPKDLPKALKMAGLEDAEINEKAKQITESFNKMWNQLENRFMVRIRFVTIVCAIIVAGYFQVSTPDLLKKLSVNKPFRDEIERVARGIEKPLALPTYGALSEKALATLEGEFPEVEEKIEGASGVGVDKADLIEELETLLTGMGERKDKIIERYNELLDGMYIEQRDAAITAAKDAEGTLATIDITGWPEHWTFYYKNGAVKWGNTIGVLITAVLLTFGAPFWFERLKEALRLKDVLSKGIKPEDSKESKKSDK
jgi:hypothetical protein